MLWHTMVSNAVQRLAHATCMPLYRYILTFVHDRWENLPASVFFLWGMCNSCHARLNLRQSKLPAKQHAVQCCRLKCTAVYRVVPATTSRCTSLARPIIVDVTQTTLRNFRRCKLAMCWSQSSNTCIWDRESCTSCSKWEKRNGWCRRRCWCWHFHFVHAQIMPQAQI